MVNNLLTEDLSVNLSRDIEKEGILNGNLLLVNHLRWNRLQHPLSLDSLEEGRILDLFVLKQGLDAVAPFTEVNLVGSWERKETSWIDSDAFDGELFGWEVTALHEERLIDVVGDAREELDLDFESFLSQNLARHVAALDYSRSRQRAQVYVEFEGHFADVLNEEVSWLALVVGNLTKVDLVGAQFERDVVRLSCDRHVIVRTAVHTDDSHAAVSETVTSVESELHVLRLVGLEDTTHGQDVKDFVNGQVLLPLLLFLLADIVVCIDLFLLVNVGCILEEGPFISDWHC